jgi:hypothetical protein
VDATKDDALKERFEVDGYPTLKFTRDGIDWQEYDLGRDKASLLEFVDRMSGPIVGDIADDAALASASTRFPLSFVLCDAVSDASALRPRCPRALTVFALCCIQGDRWLPMYQDVAREMQHAKVCCNCSARRCVCRCVCCYSFLWSWWWWWWWQWTTCFRLRCADVSPLYESQCVCEPEVRVRLHCMLSLHRASRVDGVSLTSACSAAPFIAKYERGQPAVCSSTIDSADSLAEVQWRCVRTLALRAYARV